MKIEPRVFRAIRKADVVLEVIDARFPEETRSKGIERVLGKLGKKLIIVANKIDLISKKKRKKLERDLKKKNNVVFISTKKRFGSALLRKEVKRLVGDKKATVSVIGFPNTGKSSLINMLRGKKVARTSSIAGFTRGEQWIKLDRNIRLIDTPGNIPFKTQNYVFLALIGAINPEEVNDPVRVALEIIDRLKKENPLFLEREFDVSTEMSEYNILEEITKKRGKLLRGGELNIEEMSRIIIRKWQGGEIIT